jgi:predicted secreted protein
MSLVSFTPISDGTTSAATQVNTPLTTIFNDYNGNITDANIASAARINLNKLGITISSQANAGTAGGTMYYINLGGIKLLWVSITGASAATTYGVTLPTSFFTTIQSVVQGVNGSSGTTTGQYIVTATTSSTGFSWYSGTNPQSGTSFFVIGI